LTRPRIRHQFSSQADRDRLGSLGRAVIASSRRLKASYSPPVASVARARSFTVGAVDGFDSIGRGLLSQPGKLDQVRGFEQSLSGRQR